MARGLRKKDVMPKAKGQKIKINPKRLKGLGGEVRPPTLKKFSKSLSKEMNK